MNFLTEERISSSQIPKHLLFSRSNRKFPEETGKGFLFLGKPGVGKTTEACGLLLSAMEESRILKTKFETMSGILALQKRSWSLQQAGRWEEWDLIDKRLQSLSGVSLLVVDDVAKEYASQWSTAEFDSLLRNRFNSGLRTIVTSNLPIPEWASRYSEAMSSFIHEAYEIVVLTGEDKRRAKSNL